MRLQEVNSIFRNWQSATGRYQRILLVRRYGRQGKAQKEGEKAEESKKGTRSNQKPL